MSAPQLTPELLDAPAPRAARLIARQRLDTVLAAAAALTAGAPDALHDLRVAIRRLRSWLAAYECVLDDTVSGKSMRAFRRLARETNDARDAEVHLAWLRAVDDWADDHGPVRDRLVAEWQAEQTKTAAAARKTVERRLPAAAHRLARQLAEYYVRRRVDGPEPEVPMRTETAALLRAHRRALAAALRRVRSAADVAAAHRARIAGKRLRYLLEPLDDDLRVRAVVARLKTLQDRLGEFHDAQLLRDRLIAGAAPEVAARAEGEGARAFAAFRRSWSPARARAQLRRVDAEIGRLRRGG